MPRSRARRVLRRVVELSLVLPAGAVIALIWANTAHESYERFSGALHFAVNDVGMGFFFALATKEVVEATAPGAPLHAWRRAALPVVAAAGAMAGPAFIYSAVVLIQNAPELARAWAIPCATDIALSYLVAKAIFHDHPAIPFLLLLAIDALGLFTLALLYPTGQVRIGVALGMIAATLGARVARSDRGGIRGRDRVHGGAVLRDGGVSAGAAPGADQDGSASECHGSISPFVAAAVFRVGRYGPAGWPIA